MKKIAKRLQSECFRRVISNLGYLSILEVASHLFPLITIPYLARIIGVSGMGEIAAGAAIIAYFQTLCNYSFNLTSVRDIARNKNSKEEISRIVSTTLCCKVFLAILSLIVLILLTLTFSYFRDRILIIFCTYVSIPFALLFCDWFYQGIEDMKYITILNIVSKVIFTSLIFLLIRTSFHYYLSPLLTGVSYLIPGVISLYLIVAKHKIRLRLISFREIISELRKGYNVFLSLFLPTIYSHLSLNTLDACHGRTAIGIFSTGGKFSALSFSCFNLLSRALFPYFSRNLSNHNLYVLSSFGIAACITCILFFGAKNITLLFFGEAFVQSIVVIKILAFTPIAMSLMNSYGYNYLLLCGREKEMSRIILLVSLIGLPLGIILTIKYSFIGLAVADLSTQILRAVVITVYAIHLKISN